MTAVQTVSEESICIDCGLCCDGTLHGGAAVQPHDEAAVAAAGLEISDEGDGRVFLQPCPRFSCGSCSIYATRPDVCRTYSCALLINVEAGAISPPVAREKIRAAKKLVATVSAIDPDAATPAKRSALAKRLNAEVNRLQGPDRTGAEAALRDVVALQRFLIRWFFEGKRGFVPVKGKAVDVGGRGIVLMGEEGGAAVIGAGELIADKTCFVGFDAAGKPCVTAALTRRQSELASGDNNGLERTGDDLFDTFNAPLGPEPDVRSEVPLAAFYVLADSGDSPMERLTGVEGADALFANIDRTSFSSRSWLSCARIARAVPVFRASPERALAAAAEAESAER